MNKLFSTSAIAAATLAVAFPLTASADSLAQQQAFERLNQPQPTQSQDVDAAIAPSDIEVGAGHSAAMTKALNRVQHQAESRQVADQTVTNAPEWSGSAAMIDTLNRVHQGEAS